MLPCGTGGGGTRGATDVFESGGDSSAVLIVICGGALGFSLEGIDTFRGWPPGTAVCGGGYVFTEASDGLGGCDEARLRPVIPPGGLAAVLLGNEDATEEASDCSDDALFDEVTEVFTLRCEIVPRVVEVLIRGLITCTSERIEKVEAPRDLWLSTVGLLGWVSVPLAPCELPDLGEGRGGRGCESSIERRVEPPECDVSRLSERIGTGLSSFSGVSSWSAVSRLYDPFLLWLKEAPRCLPWSSGGLSVATVCDCSVGVGVGAGGGKVVGGGAGGGRVEDALGLPICGRGGVATDILDEGELEAAYGCTDGPTGVRGE